MRMMTRVFGRRPRHDEVPDEAERELLEGRIDDWREDVYVAGGDGAIAPSLPEGTPEGLYEDFERDAERPPDLAP
ncbi:MAG: hypothetical protein ACM33B_01720 [Pseudomonadota bacterium]